MSTVSPVMKLLQDFRGSRMGVPTNLLLFAGN